MATERVNRAFVERYGRVPRIFTAPGRINLIGEHTDYNEGFVLPMALEARTAIAILPRADTVVTAHSLSFDENASFDLTQPTGGRRGHWLDFLEGTAQALIASGVQLSGADLVLDSDVPRGAGLSSSAALEVAVGLALWSVAGAGAVDRVALAKAAQNAEHQYVGTRCGIMDQYIAALGKRQHALLIDCRSLETEAVFMKLDGTSIVVCNTKASHDLATSQYNDRREQCEEGVQRLSRFLPDITSLRDVTCEAYERYGVELPELVRRRVRHVLTENARTLEACEALKTGNLPKLGELMKASHLSLRNDYEVSCRELDLAVDVACKSRGTLGARMTGGGFGGCTVNLVQDDAIGELTSNLSAAFRSELGYEPELFVSQAGEGATELNGAVAHA